MIIRLEIVKSIVEVLACPFEKKLFYQIHKMSKLFFNNSFLWNFIFFIICRFDTNVEVTLPDVKGRQEILELYIDKITHDSAINVSFWAKKTAGFSGADIQNLVNTAAIHAAAEGMYLI